MDNLFYRKQCSNLLQMLGDGFIGFTCGQPRESPCLGSQLSVAVYRDNDRDFRIIAADIKVLHTVPRSGMYAPGTAL